jgi:hypothetical protein
MARQLKRIAEEVQEATDGGQASERIESLNSSDHRIIEERVATSASSTIR